MPGSMFPKRVVLAHVCDAVARPGQWRCIEAVYGTFEELDALSELWSFGKDAALYGALIEARFIDAASGKSHRAFASLAVPKELPSEVRDDVVLHDGLAALEAMLASPPTGGW